MKIVVTSDTHIPTSAEKLPETLLKELHNSSFCIHAGDFVNQEPIEEIRKYTRLHAVSGNMDSSQIQKKFPEKKIVNIDGIKIGIIHRVNSTMNIPNELTSLLGPNLDIYIFGHTHYAFNKFLNGKLFFNPGSPTDKFLTETNSFGIIEIDKKKIEPRIIKISSN